MKKLAKELINFLYKQKENIVFELVSLPDLNEDQSHILSGFHMEELCLIEEEDDYFCGIRANHFCIEYGYSEYFVNNETSTHDELILITANHKGNRVMTLLRLGNNVEMFEKN